MSVRPRLIGRRSAASCSRMREEDAKMLFLSRELQVIAEAENMPAGSAWDVKSTETTVCCQFPKLRGHLSSEGSVTQPGDVDGLSCRRNNRNTARYLPRPLSMGSIGMKRKVWRSKEALRARRDGSPARRGGRRRTMAAAAKEERRRMPTDRPAPAALAFAPQTQRASNRPRDYSSIAMDSLMALQYAIPPRTHRLFIYSPCNAHAKISRLSMHTHRCRTPISFYYAH